MMNSIRRFSLVAAAVGALALGVGAPAVAHEDASAFTPMQWRCTDIPVLRHKQSVDSQRLVISNVGGTDLYWWFLALDPQGELMTNMAETLDKGWGTLPAYRSVVVTNSELQSRDAPADTPTEPVALCLRNDKDRGAFNGYLKVREYLRVQGASWVAFDLGDWWDWWVVVPKPAQASAARAASAPVRQ